MDMRMVDQRPRPGVQSRQDAYLPTEIGSIRSDLEQSKSSGAHCDGIEKSLVLSNKFLDPLRNVEDHVKVGNRQRLLHSRLDPVVSVVAHALRAGPVSTRVVGEILQRAIVALEDVAPKCWSSAPLDRIHRLAVGKRQTKTVASSVARSESPHDIGH